jgi:ParB family transcriptional regulator, chromosome partitioning protein
MVSDKLRKLVGKADIPIAPSAESTLPLDQITDRPGGDTRPLNQSHVEALAESIAAVGLIQPIAVDNLGRLLAGGHRRAAIAYLQTSNAAAFSKWFAPGVPVHRFDFDASQDEGRALAIEATENEKRRDYTPGEVRELADRLVAAGYRNIKGKPKTGQKAVAPTLAIIVGKSQRTIERYLAKPDNNKPTDDGLSRDTASAQRTLTKLLNRDDCPDDVRIAAGRLLKLLEG